MEQCSGSPRTLLAKEPPVQTGYQQGQASEKPTKLGFLPVPIELWERHHFPQS